MQQHQGRSQNLVVVPTRELCIQVAKDIDELAGNRGIRTLAVYGGRAFEPQIDSLNAGIEIVVGTPGRLLDLYRQGQLKLKEVSRLVLDEADEMLDLGFLPDVEKIFTSTPKRTQTMLFSAHLPAEFLQAFLFCPWRELGRRVAQSLKRLRLHLHYLVCEYEWADS